MCSSSIIGDRFNTFRPVLLIQQSLLVLRPCKSTVSASFYEHRLRHIIQKNGSIFGSWCKGVVQQIAVRSQKQGRIQRADAKTQKVGCVSGGISASGGPQPSPSSGTLEEVRLAFSRHSKTPCCNVTELVAQGHTVFAKDQLFQLMLEGVCCRRLNLNVIRQGALNTSARRSDASRHRDMATIRTGRVRTQPATKALHDNKTKVML